MKQPQEKHKVEVGKLRFLMREKKLVFHRILKTKFSIEEVKSEAPVYTNHHINL